MFHFVCIVASKLIESPNLTYFAIKTFEKINVSGRVQARSKPEGDGGCEGHASEGVGGELVVACGDAAELLEAAEGVLDEVVSGVALLVIADGAFAVAPAGDDGRGAGIPSQAAQTVGVVAFVAEQVAHAPGPSEERLTSSLFFHPS